jgi:hypothetical protein
VSDRCTCPERADRPEGLIVTNRNYAAESACRGEVCDCRNIRSVHEETSYQ